MQTTLHSVIKENFFEKLLSTFLNHADLMAQVPQPSDWKMPGTGFQSCAHVALSKPGVKTVRNALGKVLKYLAENRPTQ